MISKLLVSMAASLRLLMNSNRCSKLNNWSCSATTSRWRLLGMVLPCMRRIEATFTARLRRTKWFGLYSEGGNEWACWLLPHGRNRSCLNRPWRTDCGEVLSYEDLGEAKDGFFFGYLIVHLSYYYEVLANWHFKVEPKKINFESKILSISSSQTRNFHLFIIFPWRAIWACTFYDF